MAPNTTHKTLVLDLKLLASLFDDVVPIALCVVVVDAIVFAWTTPILVALGSDEGTVSVAEVILAITPPFDPAGMAEEGRVAVAL